MKHPVLVSVVVVSDYASDPLSARDDLLRTLRALRQQDYGGPVEHLLADTAPGIEAVQREAAAELPAVRLITGGADSADALKNAAIAASKGDIVLVLDADCEPAPGWLAAGVAALSEAGGRWPVVSGKTLYRQQELLPRLSALFTRGYLDPGPASDEALSVANNNAAFRRNVVVRCPFPEDAGPFAGRIHAQRLRDAGFAVRFCAGMLTFHAYDGWTIERDIRRHLGRTCIHSRQVEPTLPYASAARLGLFSIPFFVAARIVYDWRVCLRVHSRYGVRWYEVPLALLFAIGVRAFEIPGMLDAVLNRPVPDTHYR